ncbi:MAG: hypothetical protein ACJ8AT_06145 [Hyalangium sp.]|uniref:hypothetical protein n=1 Tax=Hyalangium sp. TaxID=2028555 RepID=UPI00389AA14A
MRLLALLSAVLLSCGCESSKPSTRPDSGTQPPVLVDGGAAESITCTADSSSYRLTHAAHFFLDGSASTTCTVELGPTVHSGSASYAWARTGQPGAVCEVAVEGGYWRFSVAQDHSVSIASFTPEKGAPRLPEALLACTLADQSTK